MTLNSLRLAVLLMIAGTAAVSAETPLNDARSSLEKWVETRQLISKTRNDWQSDKELIEQSISLLEREIAEVEEKMSKLSTNNSETDKKRIEAEVLLKASDESMERTRQFAVEIEGKIQRLVPQLPVPLQEILRPALIKLPANATNTTMTAAQRMQVIVVGVLTELDKFNSAVTLFSEKRKNDKGEEVAVETVYVGLGAAYFVNDANDFAGMGVPGPNGWEWTIKSDLAPSVREVIRIYRNERGARFVALPAVIK